jgi:hypothetical protein
VDHQVRGGHPVRSFPSFRGQKNFPGLYYAVTMDAHVGFESWVERDVAMMLDFDPNVVAFSSQPFWLIWSQEDRERRHVPDYYARLADGTGVVVDVRPDDQIGSADAETFATTERACCDVGWEFRRTAGLGATLAANVRWLAGYRHPRLLYHLLWRHALITELREQLLGPSSIVTATQKEAAG